MISNMIDGKNCDYEGRNKGVGKSDDKGDIFLGNYDDFPKTSLKL